MFKFMYILKRLFMLLIYMKKILKEFLIGVIFIALNLYGCTVLNKLEFFVRLRKVVVLF